MAVTEQFLPVLKLVCKTGDQTLIDEFYNQLIDRLDTWGQPWTRTIPNITQDRNNSLLAGSNAFRIRTIAMTHKNYVELQYLIDTLAPTYCS